MARPLNGPSRRITRERPGLRDGFEGRDRRGIRSRTCHNRCPHEATVKHRVAESPRAMRASTTDPAIEAALRSRIGLPQACQLVGRARYCEAPEHTGSDPRPRQEPKPIAMTAPAGAARLMT